MGMCVGSGKETERDRGRKTGKDSELYWGVVILFVGGVFARVVAFSTLFGISQTLVIYRIQRIVRLVRDGSNRTRKHSRFTQHFHLLPFQFSCISPLRLSFGLPTPRPNTVPTLPALQNS